MPVEPQPEPSDFFEKVQKRGEAFLAMLPQPKSKDLDNHDYWTYALEDLHKAYRSICAYSCMYLFTGSGSYQIDHFKPKSKYPQEAYRWANFRLSCARANSNKGTAEVVLDPFTLQPGWFVIDFDTYRILPGKHLSAAEAKLVLATIKRLGLNDDSFVQERIEWMQAYINNGHFPTLQQFAPFLASELKRQRLVGKIRYREIGTGENDGSIPQR